MSCASVPGKWDVDLNGAVDLFFSREDIYLFVGLVDIYVTYILHTVAKFPFTSGASRVVCENISKMHVSPLLSSLHFLPPHNIYSE